MVYLINFHIKENKDLRYPLPQTIDLAVMDETLEVQEKVLLMLPEIVESSTETLLDCWYESLESICNIVCKTEVRHLVFTTYDHFNIFHILLQKCKLHIKPTANTVLSLLTRKHELPYTDIFTKPMTIDNMIDIVIEIGIDKIKSYDEIKKLLKEIKIKSNITNCDSYKHILDTRTGLFHKKDSWCVHDISVKDLQGLGYNPAKKGYKPCPFCYKQTGNALYAIDDEIERRLINGNYALSSRIIARCYVPIHPGYLTKSLVSKHKCIEKECTFFEKLRPEYWSAYEAGELAKKRKRVEMKESIKRTDDRHRFIRKTLEESGCIYVTSIKEDNEMIGVSYIYDKKVDLMPKIRFLRNEFRKTIKLKANTGNDEAIEKLIKKPRREQRAVTDLGVAPKVGEATKKRLASLGVYCLEDLFGRSGDSLYRLDCIMSGRLVDRRFLTAYKSAVEYANNVVI